MEQGNTESLVPPSVVERMLSVADDLREEAACREAAWQQCRRYGFQIWDPSSSTPPDSNTRYVPQQDSLPAQCAWRAAMYLHANTVGVGQTFFRLDVDDATRMGLGPESAELKQLRDLTLPLMREMSTTNFSSVLMSAFNDKTVLGTCVGYVEFNEMTRSLEYSSYQVGKECYLSSNSRGKPDTFSRTFTLTVKQAVERYGDRVGPEVLKLASKPETLKEKIEYVWIVYPRKVFGEKVSKPTDKMPVVPACEKPWGHLILDRRNKVAVDVGGYDSFPFASSVWGRLPNSVYGWGPIEMSLSDVKYLGRLKFKHAEAIDRQVDPAVIVPYSWDGFDSSPGARNYIEGNGVVRDMFVQLEPPRVVSDITPQQQQCLQNIRNNCLLDAFETFDAYTKTMTATEARGRVGQSVRAIAPIVHAIHTDFLSVLIKRSLDLLIENGVLGTGLPEGIRRENVEIKYVSVLASMVLDGETNKLRDFFANCLEFANSRQAMGDMFDVYFDVDKVFEHMADFFSIPQDVIRTKTERQKKRKELEESMMAAQQQQQEEKILSGLDPQARSAPGSFAERSGF